MPIGDLLGSILTNFLYLECIFFVVYLLYLSPFLPLTFLRVYHTLNEFVRFQEAVAAQQEIGTDLEQVEVLQKKFDDFKGDLKVGASKVQWALIHL